MTIIPILPTEIPRSGWAELAPSSIDISENLIVAEWNTSSEGIPMQPIRLIILGYCCPEESDTPQPYLVLQLYYKRTSKSGKPWILRSKSVCIIDLLDITHFPAIVTMPVESGCDNPRNFLDLCSDPETGRQVSSSVSIDTFRTAVNFWWTTSSSTNGSVDDFKIFDDGYCYPEPPIDNPEYGIDPAKDEISWNLFESFQGGNIVSYHLYDGYLFGATPIAPGGGQYRGSFIVQAADISSTDPNVFPNFFCSGPNQTNWPFGYQPPRLSWYDNNYQRYGAFPSSEMVWGRLPDTFNGVPLPGPDGEPYAAASIGRQPSYRLDLIRRRFDPNLGPIDTLIASTPCDPGCAQIDMTDVGLPEQGTCNYSFDVFLNVSFNIKLYMEENGEKIPGSEFTVGIPSFNLTRVSSFTINGPDIPDPIVSATAQLASNGISYAVDTAFGAGVSSLFPLAGVAISQIVDLGCSVDLVNKVCG